MHLFVVCYCAHTPNRACEHGPEALLLLQYADHLERLARSAAIRQVPNGADPVLGVALHVPRLVSFGMLLPLEEVVDPVDGPTIGTHVTKDGKLIISRRHDSVHVGNTVVRGQWQGLSGQGILEITST
jgi:hypothetical protein